MNKIRNKLSVIFLTSLVFMVAVSLLTTFYISRLSGTIYRISTLQAAAGDISAHCKNITYVLTLYVSADSQQQAALKSEYQFNTDHFLHALNTLESSKKLEKYVVALKKDHETLIARAEKLMGLVEKQTNEEGERLNNLKLNAGYQLDQIRSIDVRVDIAIRKISESVDRDLNQDISLSKSQGFISSAVILFSFIFGTLIVLLVSRKITSSIEELTSTAQAISQGDMSKRVRVRSNDEIGHLAGVFNRMLDNMEKSQVEIKKSDLQLTQQLDELEKINQLMIGRELKMVQLKKELEALKQKG